MKSAHYLAIFAFTRPGALLAHRVSQVLMSQPWCSPEGKYIESTYLYLPRRIACADIAPVFIFDRLQKAIQTIYDKITGIIFIGATGIAVRAIAPFLTHKSRDPAIVVLDSAANFAISLVGGHLAGSNSLVRHLADCLNVIPVISTASEQTQSPALDIFLKKLGLRIRDWEELTKAQGILLEDHSLPLFDPCHIIPATEFLKPLKVPNIQEVPSPAIAVHYKKLPRQIGITRIVAPIVNIGLGFRKSCTEMEDDVSTILERLDIDKEAIRSLSTVSDKAASPELLALATKLNVPVYSYPAEVLARLETPNPSPACGKRFGQKPFSVCESAALMSSGIQPELCPYLLSPKIRIKEKLTIALALQAPAI